MLRAKLLLKVGEWLKLGKPAAFAERRDRLRATLAAVRELVQP